MMTLNETLARNRLFWATFVKVYGNGRSDFGTKKIYLFHELFPHLAKNGWPSCFACHYNLERPLENHCAGSCIIPWTGLGGCTNLDSPYWNNDAQGVLDCIDKAIKKYDTKRYTKDEQIMRRFIK